jgi:hypothetical protein
MNRSPNHRSRQAICARCPAPLPACFALDRSLPDATCPATPPRWEADAKTVGLGDAVAAVAKPIGAGLDAIFGTDIEHCVGCGKRQDGLNKAVPDLLHPFRRTD